MAQINGETVQIRGVSVLAYLLENGYQTEQVVVEKNREILTRDQFETAVIEDQDEIEILNFVGGG